MGRIRWGFLLVLLLGWVSPAWAQKTPEQWLLRFQPTLVYVTSRYYGQWRWQERTWETLTGQTATGVLVHPDGQILTLARVAQSASQPEETVKRLLLKDLARQRLELYNQAYPDQKIPLTSQNLEEASAIARQEAQLEKLERRNEVFLSGGKEDQSYAFQVKKYNPQSPLALITVSLTQTPTLVFTDGATPAAGTTVYALAQANPGVNTTPEILTGTWNGQNMTFANPTRIEGGLVFLANGQVLGLADFQPPAETTKIPPVTLISIQTIRQFLQSAGVANQDSPVNALWQKALDHFEQAHYRRAQPVLQAILKRYPQHHAAQTLLTQASERIEQGEDRTPAWPVGWIAGGLGIVVLGAGAVGLAVWFSRRPHPVPPVQGIATPSPDNVNITVPLASFETTAPPTIALTEHLPSDEAQPTRLIVAEDEPEPPTQVLVPPPEPEGITQVVTPPPAAAIPYPQVPVTEAYRPARLECIAGPVQGEDFPLVGSHYLGRDSQRCEIVIPDPQVSGQHAWIEVQEDRVILRDCGSTNGTFINSVLHPRIKEIQLHDQDVIILGQKGTVKFRFHAASAGVA